MTITYTVDYRERFIGESGEMESEILRREFNSREEVEAFAEEYFTPGICNPYGVGFMFGRLAGLRAFVGDEPAFDIPDPYRQQIFGSLA